MQKKMEKEDVPPIQVADETTVRLLIRYYTNIVRDDLHRIKCLQ